MEQEQVAALNLLHVSHGEKERGETQMRYSGLVLGAWLKGQQHDTHVFSVGVY